MAGDAFQIRIALREPLEHLVLLFVAGLEGDTVLPVPQAVVLLVPPQVAGLNAQQHVHTGQALGTIVPSLLSSPQFGAEIAVKADNKSLLLCLLETVQGELRTAGRQSGG